LFAEPLSITVGSSTVSLPRTGMGPDSGTFRTSDGAYTVTVSHASGRRHRRVFRLTSNKISADPLVPNQNIRAHAQAYLVVDHPVNGFSAAEVQDLVKGLLSRLSAGTYADVTKLVGGEA
jgi:hypothetical protein